MFLFERKRRITQLEYEKMLNKQLKKRKNSSVSLKKARKVSSKEKLSALWSCDIRILTATKEEYTKGKTIHYDSENRAVIIDRSVDISYEQLFSELSKEIAHAYLYRNNKTSYSREAFDSIADAARYIVCRQNEIDCTLPELPNDLSPNEMKDHLESIHLISATIQSNIDYYYENGKPQFEKPITIIKSADDEATEESKFESQQEQKNTNNYVKDSDKRSNAFDLFAGCTDLASLKKRYRELAAAYHPDRQNGDNASMQYINAEYEKKLCGFK